MPTATDIARRFHTLIAEGLTEEQVAEVDRRNAAEPEHSGICHTHDFCDANMPMMEAFEEATGREPRFGVGDDAGEQEDCRLWNTAWEIAVANGFSKPWAAKDA